MKKLVFAAELALFLFALPAVIFAHAYGAGGIDQYIRILPKASCIQVELDIHFAEIPSAAMSAHIDQNADGILSSNEMYAFLEKITPNYLRCLAMFYGEGNTVQEQMAIGALNSKDKLPIFDLAVPTAGIRKTCVFSFPLGEKGQRTIRIRWLFEAQWPPTCRPTEKPVTVRFRTAYVPPECCRRIVYAEPDAPLAILESDMPPEKKFPRPPDITPAITDKSQIPMINHARFVIGLKPPVATSAAVNASLSNGPPAVATGSTPENRIARGDSWLKEKVHGLLRPPLSPFTWPLAILLSLVWGATHALAPGHGKTIAGAYLVGSGTSFRHALILGLASTLSHTAVVLVLAIVGYAMWGAMTYPTWLAGVGAAAILVVGLNQIRVGLLGLLGSEHEHGHTHEHGHGHDHEHGHGPSHEENHEHTHPQGGFFRHTHTSSNREPMNPRRTFFNLAAIGLSSGMIPCPAAIILLLLSWQLSVPGLGVTCLLSFSAGLAGTLVCVGFLTILGKKIILRLLDKDAHHPVSHTFTAWLPILGGLVLCAMGLLTLCGR